MKFTVIDTKGRRRGYDPPFEGDKGRGEGMSEIKRVTDPKMGPMDGVEASIRCVVATQVEGENIKERILTECRALCSYSSGTISFAVKGLNVMLTVRLDDLAEILKEAAVAARE
jgi:hypothetical protein